MNVFHYMLQNNRQILELTGEHLWLVSISTVRAMPSALGLAQAALVGAGAAAGAGAGLAWGAATGAAAPVVGAVCDQAKPDA